MLQISAVGGGGGRPYRAELADGFQLKVEFRLGGFDVKAHAGREIAAIAGRIADAVAFVEMIQINLAVDAPAQVIQFQKTAGKQGVGVFFVPLVRFVEDVGGGSRVADDRHRDKAVELPVTVIQSAAAPAGKVVDGVAQCVSGDQSPAAEIQGLPAGNHFRADAAV